MIQEPLSTPYVPQTTYQFQLDIDIRILGQRPLFQSEGKIIYEVSWIKRRDPPVILLQINGPTADQEASFYMRFSDHPNIIKTFGRVRNDSNALMLLQERSPKPDLSEMLRENKFKPTESVLCTIFEQICNAMIFLANNNVVHGDLACHNVLVFESNPTEPKKNLVKLTDFGLTRDLATDHLTNSSTFIVPIRYIAPEILRNQNRSKYSEKSDVYSMGVLMWEACSKSEIPYSSIEKDDDVRQRKLNDERLPRSSLCSDQLWAIMNECWHRKPKHRPSFEILKQKLSDVDFQSTLQLDQQPTINRTFRSPSPCPPPITRNSSNHANTYDSSQTHAPAIQPRFSRLSSRARRDHHDRSTVVNNDETKSEDKRGDSQQGYIIEERPKSFNRSDRKNRLIPCQFCREDFPSSIALHEHLVLCGNKTELCQTCRRFIRRAIFIYHTENNCANPDESDATPSRRGNRLAPLSSRNSNRETFEINTVNVENQENRNAFNHSARSNVRFRTPISNQRFSPITVECEYCQCRVAQNDYRTHKENCLQSPIRISDRKQRSQPLLSNRNRRRPVINECHVPSTTVSIPCEICKRLIEGFDYLTHLQNCHEQNKRRMEKRAQRMSQQPVIGSIPCEFCQDLYSANQLASHETNCPQNPRNRGSLQNPIRRQYPLVTPIPSIVPSESDRNSLAPSPPISPLSSQSPMFHPTPVPYVRESVDRIRNEHQRLIPMENIRPNQHRSIDINQNHPFNGLRREGRFDRKVTVHRSRERRVANNTPFFESRNTSRNDFTYERETVLSSEHRLYDEQVIVSRFDSITISDNQQGRFRPTVIRSRLLYNNFQNSTYSSNSFRNYEQNESSNDNHFSNRLKLRPDASYIDSRRKNKRTKSHRYRSRRPPSNE